MWPNGQEVGMHEMKDSGIEWVGEIPGDWSVIRAKYVIAKNDGGVWGNDPLGEDSIKTVLRSTEQTIDGKWNICEPAQRDLSFENYRSCLIKPGDLLITKSSGSKLHIGKTTLADEYFLTHECYYSNFLQRIRVKESITPKYMWYLLNSEITRQQFVYRQNSTSGLGNINSSDIGSVYVPLPPIKTQSGIICFLDHRCSEIDALTADIKDQIETLEQYKQSVISEAVTKGLNPDAEMKDSGIEWIGEIPKNWVLTKINALYTLRVEKVSDKDYPPLSVTMKGIVPQLETAAKTSDGDNRKLVRKGDFAINSRSDRRGSCGISEYDGSVSLINTVLCPRDNMHPGYYNWLFHSSLFSDEFYRWGHGIVDDLWTTNWQDMKKILLPVPPMSEQQAIATFLDNKCAEIDAIIADKEEQLTILDEYKKSLIYEYVTGKKEAPTA